jgi:hypothetical protein
MPEALNIITPVYTGTLTCTVGVQCSVSVGTYSNTEGCTDSWWFFWLGIDGAGQVYASFPMDMIYSTAFSSSVSLTL